MKAGITRGVAGAVLKLIVDVLIPKHSRRVHRTINRWLPLIV